MSRHRPRGSRWVRLARQVYAEETHCWICGQYVDQTLHHNHPQARTADHIYPVDLYPQLAYERTNLRLAHRSCNASRSNQARNEAHRIVAGQTPIPPTQVGQPQTSQEW